MKKKMMFLTGSSLLGLALCGVVAAQAADDVASDVADTSASVDAAAPAEDAPKPRGFYLVGSFGGSFYEGASKGSEIFNSSTADSNGDGNADAFTPDHIFNRSNMMWSTMVGYRMADWLGAEVGWTDIGQFTAEDSGPNFNNKVQVPVDGLEARLRAWMPLGTDRIQGIGGLGIFIFSAHPPKRCAGPDTSACTSGPGHFDSVPPAIDPRQDSGQAFTISAGLQFKITENILLRTEYQHFFAVLDQGVNMVTASLVFGFYDFFGQGQSGGDSFGGIAVE